MLKFKVGSEISIVATVVEIVALPSESGANYGVKYTVSGADPVKTFGLRTNQKLEIGHVETITGKVEFVDRGPTELPYFVNFKPKGRFWWIPESAARPSESKSDNKTESEVTDAWLHNSNL